jgi:diaminohydroxyphosphoribosylaminopyrimidine deaminase/5-amino-6-(5-phosphoribosylamino)uracil reductase
VVGEGTYIYDNLTHAEVLALDQAGDKAAGGTAYVSLEPHDHHGKTMPCTEALIHAGIKRVVSPMEDPNPLVSGKGFARLRASGIEVVTGILKDEAERINEQFICWHKKKRPFVHLKLAMSLDGRIAIKHGASTALSGAEAQNRVQELRHGCDAILVGGNTASIDDPVLTDRSGRQRRRKLLRVVLDNTLRLREDSRLVTTAHDVPTIVFSNSTDNDMLRAFRAGGVEIEPVDAHDLSSVLESLRKREIQSVLVEGGSAVAGAFCDAGLVDKITFLQSPIVIGGDAPVAIGGRGACSVEKAMKLSDIEVRQLGADTEITGYPMWS